MSIQSLAPPEISDDVRRDVDRFRAAFESAKPFKHVVAENFFEPSFARKLLGEFPEFRPDLAKNEIGAPGGKAVNTKIREIGPAYRHLYEILASPEFLAFASRLSGIPDLLLDPSMYGGGTHDNRHGQELDPHVDFNYDESRRLHRRLNLIVYLNPEWESDWGGAIEIHSNPRKPFENQVSAFDPTFNRCVMFETNEYSWHGFPRINLPDDKRGLSRKSISIYLYTKDRPAEEVVPEHRTFYVQRFLPPSIREGRGLTAEDVGELQRLLIRRDTWIEQYQNMEIEKNGRLAAAYRELAQLRQSVRAPLTGYALQAGASRGLYFDGWVAPEFELEIHPRMPVASLVVKSYRPESACSGHLSLSLNGVSLTTAALRAGSSEVTANLRSSATEAFRLTAKFTPDSGARNFRDESRELAFVLLELRCIHPHVKHPAL